MKNLNRKILVTKIILLTLILILTAMTTTEIPACQTHNDTEWHALFDEEKNCHYNHEHKENPHDVDAVLGLVGLLYGGQEISYPWQTFSDAGTENQLKHQGYGWLVRKDEKCISKFTEGCLTDFRVQYHAIMASHGAVTRFHSFWLEARGCLKRNPAQCGIIRTGGWVDYGHLIVDGRHIPLPGDPAEIGSSRRVHYNETGNASFGTWYGRNNLTLVSIQTNRMWGLINPDNPHEQHLFCPDYHCKNNGSMMQAHAIGVYVRPELDPDGNGRVTFNGYTNQYGEIVPDCNEIGLDCIPLQIINMPVGHYEYRDDTRPQGQPVIDHDSSPPGEWWITYPN